MFKPDVSGIEKNNFKFSAIPNVESEKIILLLIPDRYADQLERIRFGDKVAEWGYGTVTCVVSSKETERIRNLEFGRLSSVLEMMDNELKLLKIFNITLLAMDELAGLGLLICLMDFNISKVMLLNPLFCQGVSTKLSRIELPTFILYSGNSKTPSASSSRKYHDLIAGSILHNMPDAPMEEMLAKKTQFFSYLKAFLANDQ
jgi:pimeloyl-ACP methyl ester carboxylesterase